MIEKLLIFMLFLCPLVFFHELGHFLIARLFGVRVEVFSLGFGPKLFRFKRGDTEYAFSLIPLGGYVKMFGDDPLAMSEIAPEEIQYSFTHKSKWARFWIVFGGPLANFILCYCILYILLLAGEKTPEIRVGQVKETDLIYTSGIRSGDAIRKIDDKYILGPTDIPIEKNKQITKLTVERLGQEREIKIELSSEDLFDALFKTPPLLRKPILVDNKGNKFILSSKDTDAIDGRSLEEYLGSQGETILHLISINKEGEISVPPVSKVLKFNANTSSQFMEQIFAYGLRPIDLQIRTINMNSAAEKAGLIGEDIIISLNGKNVHSFEDFRSDIQDDKLPDAKIEVWRKGEVKTFSVTPQESEQDGKKMRLIGVYSNVEYLGMKFINTPPKGIFEAIPLAFTRTWDLIVKTVDGFKKLITNEVSLKNIGGPIAIGKVASDSFNTSISSFFQIMALISINLGIINLFPIPVLDGGHIMFIFLEILNKGPLSRRKIEIAQQFGLSLLLILTFAALFNDFTRLF